MAKSKRVLVLSDIHSGSIKAVKPHCWETEDGTELINNSLQDFILEHWMELAHQIGRVEHLVLNGDLCDGVNRKAQGMGLWTTDRLEQAKACAALVKMFDAKKISVINGSGYHTDDNPSLDALVARELNCKFYPELKLEVDKINFHFCHKVGTSSSAWFYRPTPVAREMMLAALTKEEYGGIDILVRSHAHYFVAVRYPHSLGVITPCWKGRDVHAAQQTLAYTPALGAVYFDVQGDEYTWDDYIFTLKGDYIIPTVKA
jgi:predicted phosphodiesterase